MHLRRRAQLRKFDDQVRCDHRLQVFETRVREMHNELRHGRDNGLCSSMCSGGSDFPVAVGLDAERHEECAHASICRGSQVFGRVSCRRAPEDPSHSCYHATLRRAPSALWFRNKILDFVLPRGRAEA